MLLAVQFGLGTALASGNISFTTGFYRPEADVRCKMLKGCFRLQVDIQLGSMAGSSRPNAGFPQSRQSTHKRAFGRSDFCRAEDGCNTAITDITCEILKVR